MWTGFVRFERQGGGYFLYWLWTLQYMRNAMVGLGEISSEMWNWKSLQCVRPSILGQWVKQEPEMLFRTPIAATTSQSWVTQTNAVRIKIKWNWCHTTLICIGNSTVSRGIWDKFREWYFKIHQTIMSHRGEWCLGSFEISWAGIYPK